MLTAEDVTWKVRRYSGGVYDVGPHIVWCPKYRRRVLGGQVAVRLRELIVAKAAEKDWEIIALEKLLSDSDSDQTEGLAPSDPRRRRE